MKGKIKGLKKILFVIDSLNCGGAEKSLTSLLNQMNFAEYSVDLLLFSNQGIFIKSLPNNINILKVPHFFLAQNTSIISLLKKRSFGLVLQRTKTFISLRNPNNRKKLHFSQIYWKNISNYIEKLDDEYDVAIAYSQGVPTYFVADKVKATKKLCWVNTDYKLAGYNREFDRKFYHQYNNIVAVSDYNKDVFLQELPIFKDKIKVIYDIISPKLIKNLSTIGNGFSDEYRGIRILTIGRLVEAKGYDLAIEACRLLKQMGIKFKWYVVGEGFLRKRIERMITEFQLEDVFILLGVSENPYRYITECDIYVQPSRFEGFGLAIAEAKVLHKPILATNFTVVHNQLKNMVNGVIVDMDAGEISKGIKEMLKNKDLLTTIKSNLEKENLDNESEVNKLYLLIEDLGISGE